MFRKDRKTKLLDLVSKPESHKKRNAGIGLGAAVAVGILVAGAAKKGDAQ